jgi:hypothetical protein
MPSSALGRKEAQECARTVRETFVDRTDGV